MKDFSLLQCTKFTGGFFLLGRDSYFIVRCLLRSEIVFVHVNKEPGYARLCVRFQIEVVVFCFISVVQSNLFH